MEDARSESVLYAFFRSRLYDESVSWELRMFAQLWLSASPKFKNYLRSAAIKIREENRNVS